ncbi:recombinase family protein [Candidatus Beckwithbacteria bacterium]|nr:recombinase family protein [Candidatus Beckwithbacteria bacterium]
MENAVAVIRVSTVTQSMRGDSPEDQKQQIERYAQARSIRIKKYFVFMDSASKEQQPVQEAINYCIKAQNHIQLLIIKSIDRFTRGGSSLYDLMKTRLTKHGVKLIDLYGVISNQSVNTLEHLSVAYSWSVYNPTKKTELLEAERGKDEMRDIMTRMIGAEIRYVRLGYYVRAAPLGYQNQKIETVHGRRNILVPHPVESKWIIAMFRLKAEGFLSDHEIVQHVNLSGFKTRRYYVRDTQDKRKVIGYQGGKALTIKNFDRLLKKPIYAGINCEKWTANKPVKCVFPGLVSIDLFNKANKDKMLICEQNGEVQLIKGKAMLKRFVKSSKTYLYPYKRLVLCPICRQPFFASASRGRLGIYYPAYHCNKRGHYYRVPLKKFNQTVINFLSRIRIKKKYNSYYQKLFKREWKQKQQLRNKHRLLIDTRLQEIDTEIKLNLEKVNMLYSKTALSAIEVTIGQLEREKKKLQAKRSITLKNARNDKNKHPQISQPSNQIPTHIINDHNTVSRERLFNYLFQTLPTYEELEKFSAKLNREFTIHLGQEKVMQTA